jgi:excisionase family DNA binding protein
MKRLLRLAEVAELLAVSARTARRLADEGELISLIVRGSLRITWASVEDYQVRQALSRAEKYGRPLCVPDDDKWLFPDSVEGSKLSGKGGAE